MDEIFHVAQTRLYCRGIYNEWNPMITTPPGLYFLAVLFGFCGYERYLNSLILPFCFAGLCRLRRFILISTKGKLKKEIDQFRDVRLSALAICFLPVLLNNSFLYYTDLLSLTAFIWGISFNSSLISSIFLALAVLTRQTNIVWPALNCLAISLNLLKQFLFNQISFKQLFFKTFKFIYQFLLVFAFMCFLVWNNGSIVLGDKTAHKPAIHLPQLFYFVGFTAASSMPLFISYFFQNYKKIFNRFSLISMLFISLFAFLSVNCCTLAHPYLLADNRHFTFYLWQRFFQRHWIAKYLAIPFYTFSAIFMFKMTSEIPNKLKAFYLVFTSLCLIPAFLLEFRYFIIPFALWRLSLDYQSRKAQFFEILINLMVSSFVLYLFLNRPFKWPSDPERWQRFMW
uniref:Dol-P-Glc:Glc(2)Man(9)GlcNAc(2)-PP-Dol alpha-1,2-glucosyltransferase n=1 Tax=Meloidogyne enterolobii TaxID=390850 RepID=A0A6V7UJ91_MELEN|nr:unnamed protein product [Meloidogyne enterolobii]